MPNVVQISDSIFRDLSEPTSLSITSIAFWLRYVGLGKLNISIDTSIELDSALNFSPELSDQQAAILAEIYYVNYFDKVAFSSLGANSYETTDSWTEITEGDSRIKRVSRVDTARVYTQLKKDHAETLEMLITRYRLNAAQPLQENYIVYDNL